MSLTIGRITLTDPTEWSETGRGVTLSGWIKPTAGATDATNAAALQAIAGQLAGLWDNPDEDVYPLTWDLEPYLDGYYTMTGPVSVTRVNVGATRVVAAQWSMTLARVEQPMFETFSSVVLRTNSHSVTGTPDCIVGTFPSAKAYEVQSSANANITTYTRVGINGSIGLATTKDASSYPCTASVLQSTSPADHYIGCPSIEVQGMDGVWRPVVGRVTPSGAAGKWRLTNDVFRVAPSTTAGHLTVSIYDSVATAWESTDFYVGAYGGSWDSTGKIGYSTFDSSTPLAPAILRNSVDEVAIRFNAGPFLNNGTSAGGIIDICLTRGAHQFTIRGVSLNSTKWGVAVSSAAGATNVTYGLRRTSNDSNGNRWIIMNAETSTNDTTDGIRYLTSAATSFLFAIGIELNGTTAVNVNGYDDLAGQFFGAAAMSTRAIAR